MNTVCVTPKNDTRVPSKPDITSGMSSFRITIERPMPSALHTPIDDKKLKEDIPYSTVRLDH